MTPEISVSVRAVRDLYQGDCSAASTDQEPTFEGTITVSAGPVTVAYHWTLTDAKGTTASISGTLTFPGTGSQAKTTDYSVPVNQYLPDTNNEGGISLQADSPSTAAAPQQLPYFVDCSAASPSPSPNPSTSGSNVAVESRPAGDQPATLVAHTTSRGNGYQIEPSLTLGNDSFIVDVTASHHIGPAELTWKLHGELDDFFSGGALHIVNHKLRDSSLAITRLHGQLRLDWGLSAAVPHAIADKLSRDLHFRLFVVPLLIGDFPVYLALEIHPDVELDFKPGQVLHGYVAVGFSGSQGLSIHLRAIDHSNGLSIGGLRLDPGIRDLLALPTLKAGVDFPYLSLGDDFYSTGAWLWTSPAVGVSIVPGRNPGLCARGEAEVSASVGAEFQLFGFREPLSVQVFDHRLPPAVSFPRNPECMAS